MENELLEMVESLLNMIDPDGICENGCSCGECYNCIDFDTIQDRFNELNTNKRAKQIRSIINE